MRPSCATLFFVQFFLFSFISATISPDFLNAISTSTNSSLLWGPYRPNLYFGVRPRLPNSLLTGLLWANVNDYKAFQGSPPRPSNPLHELELSQVSVILAR